MNWSAPIDPDAPAQEDNSWVEAFRGITTANGVDLADQLVEDGLHRKPLVRSFAESELQRIAERILSMQTLIEQNANVRVDGSELVMARTNREAAEAVQRQSDAGVIMGGRAPDPAPQKFENFGVQAKAAARIAAARAKRAAAGEPDRENDRNAIEANPLGGDR